MPERVLSQLQLPATPDGYGELLAWAGSAAAGRSLVWAIEGTRHYGLGLARHLAAAGQHVGLREELRHLPTERRARACAALLWTARPALSSLPG